MDLKYLNTFRVIIEEGSFVKAATRLNYTQSTITFQIRQLEEELSVTLFEKVGRKMVLTKAGERLVPYIDDVMTAVTRLKNFEEDLAQCQGDLHIGVAETILCYHMPTIMKEFHDRAPKARLFLRSMNCYDIRDELLAGTLDLGIFYNDVGGYGSNLITYPLGTYPLALVVSPGSALQPLDFTAADQTFPIPFVINEPNCIFRQIFEQYLREQAITLDHTIELWSIPTIKNLVKNNVGISYLPQFAVQEELNNGTLVALPTKLTDTTISAVCGHHKNKWISPLMQLFIDLCTAHLNKNQS